MFDSSTLAQLKNLKADIYNSTPRYTGVVKSTQGRYGFAVTESGASFFLAPEEMDKVFPFDEIDFKVVTDTKGKQKAIIEKLQSTSISELWGTYQVRGKGHFIEADTNIGQRWVFIPPNARKNAKAGDFIYAKLKQHPYPSGRAQAEIIEVFGAPEKPQVEQQFMLHKYQIATDFSAEVMQQVACLLQQGIAATEDTLDLTHLPFITIDSPHTRDIDDALLVEAQTEGWRLWVAIADPAALIAVDSPLDMAARQRATTVYMPDMNMPMLPRELSENLCSLSAGDVRRAMVAELHVNDAGDISDVQLHNGLIKSQARLNYNQVTELLEQGVAESIAPSLQGHIMHLDACTQALRAYRQQHCIIMDEKRDYKLLTDDNGKLVDICKLERHAAHRVVEECMLASNRAVAGWLYAKQKGIYITNAGVRTERQGDMGSLIQELLALDKKPKFSKLTLSEYLALFKQAQNKNEQFDIRLMLSRQMDRSFLNLEPLPHMGLGFAHYTTFSSPLRKYNDLLVHRLIKNILASEPVQLPSQTLLDDIQAQQNTARMAANQVEQWLKFDWLLKQPQEQCYQAQIFQLMPHGLRVRLLDSGIDGYVDLNKDKKWQLDNIHMQLFNKKVRFSLNQEISVSLQQVDKSKRNLLFKLAENKVK